MRAVAVRIISASFAREILAGNHARVASVIKGCVIGIYARVEHGDSNTSPIDAVDRRAVPRADRICAGRYGDMAQSPHLAIQGDIGNILPVRKLKRGLC